MENSCYKTQSLYEGAFLMAKGFSLAGKEKPGSKITILFEYTPEISEKAMEFYNGGKVEAKKYTDCYRTLKDYIFER